MSQTAPSRLWKKLLLPAEFRGWNHKPPQKNLLRDAIADRRDGCPRRKSVAGTKFAAENGMKKSKKSQNHPAKLQDLPAKANPKGGIVVTKPIDIASPKLFEDAASSPPPQK